MLAFLIVLLLAGGQDFGLDPHSFQHPIDYASAVDVKEGTLFSVSYGLEHATRVCISTYDETDTEYMSPLEQRCFEPKRGENITLYVWKDKNLKDLGNVMVVIYHTGSPPTAMVLAYHNS